MDREDREKQLMMDFKNTFTSEAGKRVLEDLKDLAKYNLAVLPLDSHGRIDIHAVMRNEGKRTMITHIEAMVGKDPNIEKQKIATNKES